jgi:phospholipase D1/2
MIYVHSKLLIVDDAIAILGSANINDRSLNGNGDTELAAVIVDDASASMSDVGQGIKVITRKFAKDLRMRLWEKHLGMSVDQQTTGVSKQSAPSGINLDHPLDVDTIVRIQKIAAANRAAYNEVFTHTPRDTFKAMAEGRQAYKVHYKDRNGKLHHEFSAVAKPDLQSAFMSAPGVHSVAAAINKLSSSVKGFWVEMPLDWGAAQVATPKAPVSPAMIARADAPAKSEKVSA